MAELKIKISQLRTHITVQEKHVSTDENFQPTVEFRPIFEAWAFVAGTGTTFSKDQSSEPSTTHSMIVRYDPRFKVGQRVMDHDQNFYTIHAMSKDTHHRLEYFILDVEQEQTVLA